MPLISFIPYKITKLLVGITPLGSESQITSGYGLINSTTLTTRLPKERCISYKANRTSSHNPFECEHGTIWQSQCLGVRPAIQQCLKSSSIRCIHQLDIAFPTATPIAPYLLPHLTNGGDVLSIIKYMKGKTNQEPEKKKKKKNLLLLVMLAITG